MMKRSLSIRLFFHFAVVITLSLSAIGLFTYTYASTEMNDQLAENIAQTMRNTAYQTELYLQNYDRATYSILSNGSVKHFLDMNSEDSYAYYEYSRQIKTNVFPPVFMLYPQIKFLYVIGDNGRVVIDDNQNSAGIPDIDAAQQYKELLAATPANGESTLLTRSIRSGQSANVITIARRIRGVSSYTPNGVLAMEVNVLELDKIWGELDLGQGGYQYVMDQNGTVIYTPGDEEAQTAMASNTVNRLMHMEAGSLEQNTDGTKRLLISELSAYSGWRFVASVPLSELQRPIATIRSATLWVGAGTLLAALVVAYRIGASQVEPIRVLMNGMRQTEKGIWNKVEMKERRDEIGVLIRSYNLMVSRLSDMIESVYESELRRQKSEIELQQEALERHRAEFQALQLQINPHFLYNTLETIKCYAVVQDSEEIAQMVESMAHMLRYSIQTNLEEITVANELKHVLAYLSIMKHRMDRELEVEVIIAPDLLLEKMVRLTLQPLVENVLQHAFPRGMEPGHFIRIDARRLEDRFLVIVQDNGMGMSEERLEKLRDRLELNRLAGEDSDDVYHRGGIGLMNVHRRIQLVFGETYGLMIESEQGLGTTITMALPADQHSKRI
ncbi:two-component system sensor histidine kinase YesM [Paenibacillus pabuli]|uniref:histidine kinase n=2 Tax=Paenibacillus TaxID=44249 RepID=A0ABX9BHP0_9BACL|nr:sensor histidine kinase [Paenibacillus pabuli]RAI93613.1 two-component system sensor histidine kinase YesM [Paenibacillus pabuli]